MKNKIQIEAPSPLLPIFTVEGKGYELGRSVGQQARTRIQKTLVESNDWFYERKKEDLKDSTRLDMLLKFSKLNFPEYVEEIEGVADGSEMDFRDIWIMNCADSIQLGEHCTDIHFKTPQKLILGHNEDFNNATSDLSYFLHMKLESGSEIFAQTYPGMLPGYSFACNSFGLAMTCNTVPNYKKVDGVPRQILDRWALESENIEEIVHRLSFSPRSGTFSYNILSVQEHRLINLETTQDSTFMTEIEDLYFHTNHYLEESCKDIPLNPISTSPRRFKRLMELKAEIRPKMYSKTKVLSLLSDKKVLSIERQLYPGWYGKSFATSIFESKNHILSASIYPYSRNSDEIVQIKIMVP